MIVLGNYGICSVPGSRPGTVTAQSDLSIGKPKGGIPCRVLARPIACANRSPCRSRVSTSWRQGPASKPIHRRCFRCAGREDCAEMRCIVICVRLKPRCFLSRSTPSTLCEFRDICVGPSAHQLSHDSLVDEGSGELRDCILELAAVGSPGSPRNRSSNAEECDDCVPLAWYGNAFS